MAAQGELVIKSSAAQIQSLSICSLISPVFFGWHHGCSRGISNKVVCCSGAVIVHLLPDLSCFFGWHHGCSRGISNEVVCCSGAVIVHLLPDLSCFFFGVGIMADKKGILPPLSLRLFDVLRAGGKTEGTAQKRVPFRP